MTDDATALVQKLRHVASTNRMLAQDVSDSMSS